jgi:DNA-binding MarR family transcriptional regulator
MQVLGRVRWLCELLDDQRQRAFAAHGLGAHEFDVLAVLRRFGDGAELTPGQLLDATHVTSRTMSNRLERLAQRELITRRSDPRDGRRQLIGLTAAGQQHVDAELETLLSYERRLVASLPDDQSQNLVRSLGHLLEEQALLGHRPARA